MTIKTMLIVLATVLLTIILMQNTGSVKFTLLFTTVYLSELVVLATFAIAGFIIGVLVARRKKPKYDIGGYHDSIHKEGDTRTLSDEDKEYIK